MKKQLLCLCSVALFAAGNLATAQYYEPVTKLDVVPTKAAITIDGTADASYGDFQATTICKAGAAAGAAGIDPYLANNYPDFGAEFKLCWDTTYLYLYAEVTDDIAENYVRGKEQSWTWDNVEAFIDLDTSSLAANKNIGKIQMRFNRGLLSKCDVDSLVESAGGNVTADKFLFSVNNDAASLNSSNAGWSFEVAIPWTAAMSGTIDTRMSEQIKDVIGFDFAVADADGDGSATTGGRNIDGGQQAFWDTDKDPATGLFGKGTEDNAYQDKLTYGWITLTGTPVNLAPVGGTHDYSCTIPISSAFAETLRVYPNPSTGLVKIEGATTEVSVYTITGSLVKTIKASDEISVSLESGIYFIKANGSSQKLVVK